MQLVLDIISKITTNVLTAIYEPFWFALLLSIFFMYFYMFTTGQRNEEGGVKGAIHTWICNFKTDLFFRKLFLLTFFVVMILCRTLINREMWDNPLSDVMGNWSMWKVDSATGEKVLSTECFENIIMFVPFTFLMLWTYKNKMVGQLNKIWYSLKISFCFSLGIELLQLFLRLGTFQFSDLTYNTLGGLIGGVIYVAVTAIKNKTSGSENKR